LKHLIVKTVERAVGSLRCTITFSSDYPVCWYCSANGRFFVPSIRSDTKRANRRIDQLRNSYFWQKRLHCL